MKALATVVISMALFAQLAFGQDKPSPLDPDTLVRRLGESFIETTKAPGLSVGLYTGGKDRFYNFGTTEIGKANTPSEKTLYEVGSIAKTFTSVVLATALSEKRISLDDDIRKYLKGDYPNLEYGGHPVRIAHLASATSALPDWLPPTPEEITKAHPDSVSYLRERIYGSFTRQDFYTALRQATLDTLPGAVRKHSNAGGDLLTYALESVYQTPYRELVERHVFEAFQMQRSAFTPFRSGVTDLAIGYNGNAVRMPYMSNGFSSTAADLLKYMKTHLEGKNERVRLALTRTASVDLSTNRIVQRDSNVYTVALNWYSYKPVGGISQTWYDGGTHGFLSYVAFYPEIDTAVVLLTNAADAPTYRRLTGIASDIARGITGK